MTATRGAADPLLTELLRRSASLHSRLCPRQVLGVRSALRAARLLGLEVPREDRRLLAVVETDGCFADAVSVATGCRLGRRTLRFEDYGKTAATFVDLETERAFRVVPHPASRRRARAHAPEAPDRWHAQLFGYQRMPAGSLLAWRPVVLRTPAAALVGRAGERKRCACCAEEIVNRRGLLSSGRVLCRACAEGAYYQELLPSAIAGVAPQLGNPATRAGVGGTGDREAIA